MNKNFYRIKLYVPSVRMDYLDKVEFELITLYSGYSRYTVAGGYIGLKGRIKEVTEVYEVYTNEIKERALKALCENIKHDLKQECVLCVVEQIIGEVNFI